VHLGIETDNSMKYLLLENIRKKNKATIERLFVLQRFRVLLSENARQLQQSERIGSTRR
jgi:hypothetical protein